MNKLAKVIMPSSGVNTIWATDFESGSSYHNCTPNSDPQFSFSSNLNDISKVFTCQDILASNTVIVGTWQQRSMEP